MSDVNVEIDKGVIILTHAKLPDFALRVVAEIKKVTVLHVSIVKRENNEWVEVTPREALGINQLNMLYSSRSRICKDFGLAITKATMLTDKDVEEIMRDFVMTLQGRDYESDVGEVDLDAEVTRYVKPCGFYGDLLLECCYVPLRRSDTIVLSRAIIVRDANSISVKPFTNDLDLGGIFVSGEFPSPKMESLPTTSAVKATQQLFGQLQFTPETFRLIDDIIDASLRRHLLLSDVQYIFLKRYIEGTYFFDTFEAYPILNIIGSSENGKSRALRCAAVMSFHGDFLVDPTEAVLFRNKEAVRPTLCIDEAEYLNEKETRQRIKLLLNASYSKDAGYVMRNERDADGVFTLLRFDLYSPVAIAGITGLEGVLRSRSLLIVMPRANRDYPKAIMGDYRFLRDCLYVLRFLFCFDVKSLYDQTIESDYPIEARYFELFRPIFALTKIFGTETEMQMLMQYAKQIETNERNEAETNISDEQMVLGILDGIVEEHVTEEENWYPIDQLIAQMQQPPYQIMWRPQVASNVLRRMGITRRKKIVGKTMFFVERKDVDALMRNYGMKAENE